MSNAINFLKTTLQTKAGDEFRLISEKTIPKTGVTTKRFQQYYRGVKVDNAQYLLHSRNGYIEVMKGGFQDVNIPTVVPVFNEQQTLLKALEYST